MAILHHPYNVPQHGHAGDGDDGHGGGQAHSYPTHNQPGLKMKKER